MNTTGASPAPVLETLSDRFGALEAVAYSSLKLSPLRLRVRDVMDLLLDEALLEFGEELRHAREGRLNA